MDSASACVRGSDVVVAATSSATPVFDGADVGDGTHVIAIGSYRPDARELDSSLVSRASVYVDSREAAMEEAGDIQP
ncbi:MAG: ornithine cyclodeaminase family protein, partial [Nitrososphaerota archaeon]|nr:ornithine cyclodeaminase family protein [Nitrososphaerota archaeon]